MRGLCPERPNQCSEKQRDEIPRAARTTKVEVGSTTEVVKSIDVASGGLMIGGTPRIVLWAKRGRLTRFATQQIVKGETNDHNRDGKRVARN